MNIISFIRGLRNVKSEIKETEDKIKNGELNMSWKDIYDKHKAKIWSLVWIGLTYINDAVNNLPVLKEVKIKVEVMEKDVATIKSDLEEIKMVLTPPSN
jgi:hypothetical protein